MSPTLSLRRLLAALSVIGFSLPVLPVSATTTPTLLKGPGDAVYYLGSDNRRYVFPNASAYKTWYADFNQVKTVTLGELAGYPIGGNVTYRPGVRLVKITTDPRVYAVASGGQLRWVTTETVAKALYGTDWNKQIDDVPDAFFINYTMGRDIVNASDFPREGIVAAATSIDGDLAVRRTINPQPLPPQPTIPPGTTPPTSTSTVSTPPVSAPGLEFTLNKQVLQGGDSVLLTGKAASNVSVQKVELFADGQLIKLCTAQTCTGEFFVPISGTKDEYVFEGRLTKLDASVESSLIRLKVMANGSSKVKVTVGQASITPGQLASVVVDVSPDIAITRVDITVGGGVIKGCADGARQCRWADYLSGGVGTVYPVFAKVTDTLGRTYTSKSLSITIASNDTPGVTVSAAKLSIYAGETVEVTVSASDNDGIATIDVMQGETVLKHCQTSAPCTVMAGPFTQAGTLEFGGRATDSRGANGTASETATVTVTKP